MALENWHPKGSLCDNKIHVPMDEIIERSVESWRYKYIKTLKKMANNPILSDECKDALCRAVHEALWQNWYRDFYRKFYTGKKPFREDRSTVTGYYYEYGAYFCKTCGHQIDVDYYYCPGCGKEFEH